MILQPFKYSNISIISQSPSKHLMYSANEQDNEGDVDGKVALGWRPLTSAQLPQQA